ncbi:MAG: putative DNA binding domain-containing protein [Bacteroidales bacterium]|nr:putative DNA binding domain-containing protein [Bacteroidales bacterium]
MTKEQLLIRLGGIEWDDFEVKTAKNELPKNIWETVSAFANTIGGWIILGVSQKGQTFVTTGVDNAEKIEQDFTTVLRSGNKFNQPLVFKTQKFEVNSKIVLAFYIASSKVKPVYINSPVNTFLRVGSGDQRATDGEIMAMYHDQSFGIKSEELVANTSLADLNSQSLITYRNHLNFYNSEFPYNSLEDEAFCKKIGICSSTTGELSYGSLLMFGKQDSIRAAMPNFWVDYIEIPGISVATARPRYTFRMQEQENIWEYYKVIIQRLRLYADNPYTTTRFGVSPEDDSQLYALREGLINFLAHSDWFSPMHPTIRVFMDRIEFQNPGGFIVPVNRVLEEAISLPRNPIIIKLFRFAKLSENAGYGIDKMKTWTALTGKNVGFRSDVTHATITYFKKSPFVAAYASEPTNFYINEPISDPVNQNNPKNDPINELISQNEPINEPINQNDPVSDPIKNTETIIKILGGLIENPQIKYEDLQITANCSRATIRRTLKKLREVGIIIREGSRKTGHWIVTENGKKILKSQKR